MPLQNADIYGVKVIASSLGGTPNAIKAWAPEEMSFSVESTWDSPIAGISGSIGNLVALGGFSLQTKEQATQVWQGTSPIQITIPLRFYARSRDTAKADVDMPIMNLAKLAVPNLKQGATFLDPPGPVLQSVTNVLSTAGFTGIGDRISIEVGRYVRFSNVIISTVNIVTPLKLTDTGGPLTSTAELTFRTFDVITKPDLNSIFGL